MASDRDTAGPSDDTALAALLRSWRERELLTQEQLAERAGLSARTVRRVESGRLRPRSGSLRLLADALGLSEGERARLTAAAWRQPPVPATAPPAVHPPCQLPADVAGFIGRDRHLQRLDAMLAGADTPGAVVISAIAGTAGVGKTAMAVHWAHRVSDRFPDGQLYVGLRGYASGPPLSPLQALALLLQGLGVEADRVPVEQAAAAALYRSLLAGRRVLIVLDNARDAAQVRPLLPGSPGCLVVVTSRDRLTGLVATAGARRLTLDVLTPAEAVALLAGIAGEPRVAAEPAAAAELAGLCGHLPLALRIAAANLACQPDQPIAGYVAELRAGDTLAGLEVEGDPEVAVRAAFDHSYRLLPADARRLFRLLGLIPGPDCDAAAAAALTATTVAQVRRPLERLAAGHLLEVRGPGRYAQHDLLRLYARQLSQQRDGPAERRAALGRLLSWYLQATDAAARRLYPGMLRLPPVAAGQGLPPAGFDDHAAALDWLDTERANLVAAVTQAAEDHQRSLAWLLADALRGYLGRRRHTIDWLAVAGAALTAAEAEGDPRAQAAARLSLALAHWTLGGYPRAIEHSGAALALASQAGWVEGQATILGNLGIVYTDMGQLEQAADHHARALALHRRTGHWEGEANALSSLGLVDRELGRLQQAADHQSQALALFRAAGSRSGAGSALDNLGELDHELGRPEDARQHLAEALDLHRQVGNRNGEAYALRTLAAVHRDAGHHPQALRLAGAAVALARQSSDHRIHAEALNTLGSVQLCLERPEAAVEQHLQALDLARRSGTRYPQAEALLGLAAGRLAQGRHDRAVADAQQALALCRQAGYRVLEGQANGALAAAHHAAGRHEQAIEHARRALASLRASGHRFGQARTLVTLGRALDRAGAAGAVDCWREALALLCELGAPEAGEVRALLSRAG